jgi:hypothetical protein
MTNHLPVRRNAQVEGVVDGPCKRSLKMNELLNRLADVFTTNGVVGDGLSYVLDHEREYEGFVEKSYEAYSVMSRSFQEFYMDTLEESARLESRPLTFADTFCWHFANFRVFRAADILFRKGYPTAGLAYLRSAQESALYFGAMLNGLTSYQQITGQDGINVTGRSLTREEACSIRKRRQKEEQRIRDLMIRGKSGLTSEILGELKRWESFFNVEIHGALLTQALEQENTVSVAPKPRDVPCNMFIHRFFEVSWMIHRTLPIMQLSNQRFTDEWATRWQLLDDNFRRMEESLAQDGREIGTAFTAFIDVKFPFDPSCCFGTHVQENVPKTGI